MLLCEAIALVLAWALALAWLVCLAGWAVRMIRKVQGVG